VYAKPKIVYDSPMNVLLLGGTGLISTAISRQLLEQGHHITLYNRGKSQNRLPEGAVYEEIIGDRKDTHAFENAFSDKHYDVVVDMIAFAPDDTLSAIIDRTDTHDRDRAVS
jgi:uncharacterized protein YbjT (DUF2867 family)